MTVALTPDEGFQAKVVAVTDRNIKEIVVTDNGEGIYSFTMPASAVTVTPLFSKIEPGFQGCSNAHEIYKPELK